VIVHEVEFISAIKITTMQKNAKWIDALNRLVRINYERVYGYEKAIQDIDHADEDLVTIFNHNASQSRINVHELRQIIHYLGGKPIMDPTTRGKLLRIWMDFKDALISKDRKVVLDACEARELAVQYAYDEVLSNNVLFPNSIRLDIIRQKRLLRNALMDILDASLQRVEEEIMNH